jgi:hypothetical protein
MASQEKSERHFSIYPASLCISVRQCNNLYPVVITSENIIRSKEEKLSDNEIKETKISKERNEEDTPCFIEEAVQCVRLVMNDRQE